MYRFAWKNFLVIFLHEDRESKAETRSVEIVHLLFCFYETQLSRETRKLLTHENYYSKVVEVSRGVERRVSCQGEENKKRTEISCVVFNSSSSECVVCTGGRLLPVVKKQH